MAVGTYCMVYDVYFTIGNTEHVAYREVRILYLYTVEWCRELF